jgi:ankyrin repeat protein
MQFLNTSFNWLINLEKNDIAYHILKKYNGMVIYNDAYVIYEYIIKYKLELDLDFYEKKYDETIDYYDDDDQSLLIDAINNGCIEMTNYLIELGFELKDYLSYPNSVLLTPCRHGMLPMIKFLIEKDIDVNDCDFRGIPILGNASEEGHLEVVKYLVENGADVNLNNDATLVIAVSNDQLEIVKYLVENGANVNALNRGAPVLSYAYSLNMAKYLTEMGADIHALNEYNESIIMKYICHDNKDNCNEFDNGQIAIIPYILEIGFNIDLNEILVMCFKEYDFKTVTYILKYYLHKHFSITDIHIDNYFDIIKYLGDLGVDIHNRKHQGLVYASYNNNLQMVKYLVEIGANVNAVSNDNRLGHNSTPLKYAAIQNNFEMVDYLVENGANVQLYRESLFRPVCNDGNKMYYYLVALRTKQ